MKKALFIVSFGLLAALVYFSDPRKVLEELSKADLFYVALGLSIWPLSLALRTLRWQLLLQRLNIHIPFWRAAEIYIASMYISSITPAKSGDPVRSVLLKSAESKSFSTSIPSLFIERMSDVLVTTFFASLGVVFLASSLTELSTPLYGAIALYLTAIAVIFFVMSSESRSKKFFSKMFAFFSFIPSIRKRAGRVDYAAKNIHESFVRYRSPGILVLSLAITAIIWFLEGLLLYFSLLAVGVTTNPLIDTTIVSVSVLIAVITLLPGGIGSAEVVTVLMLSSLYGTGLADVTSASILQRLLSYWIYVVLGAIMLNKMKMRT